MDLFDSDSEEETTEDKPINDLVKNLKEMKNFHNVNLPPLNPHPLLGR